MINNAYFLIALDIELRKCFPNKTYYESRKNKEEEIDKHIIRYILSSLMK